MINEHMCVCVFTDLQTNICIVEHAARIGRRETYTKFYSANSEEREPGVQEMILGSNLKETGDRLDSIRSNWASVADVHKYGSEPSGSIKGRNIFHKLRGSVV